MDWTVPKIDGLRAAFRQVEEGIAPADPDDAGEAFRNRAALTSALWRATQQWPDAAMMLVKSDAGTSIGLLNGGLIIEGSAKLNLGLVRAKTRELTPVAAAPEVGEIPSANRLRRSTWQILTRLQDAQVPRVYRFKFGDQTGQVRSDGGTLRFGEGFADPAAFMAALTAACESEGELAYTLDDLSDDFGDATYQCGDLLHVITDDGNAAFEFDPEGWPLSCPKATDFITIKMLSAVAIAACAMSDQNGDLSLSVMSDDNRVILSGKTTEDRSLLFVLP